MVSVFKSVIPQEPLAVGASCARDFHWGVTQTITELFFNLHVTAPELENYRIKI